MRKRGYDDPNEKLRQIDAYGNDPRDDDAKSNIFGRMSVDISLVEYASANNRENAIQRNADDDVGG